jgi:hypothetical protein
MSDNKIEPKTDRTKSIQGVPAAKPSRPVTHWKRWKFRSSILLMLLAAVAIIVYLLPGAVANEVKGIGAALCVLSCGGFLVWHAVHFFAEQDVIDEKEYPEEFPELKSTGKEGNPTTPPEAK